jgi:ketosteroid isomerase-like protein
MMGWMQRYIAAWNSHDATQVGAFMEDDAIYEDLALGQVHAGRTAIEAFVATAHEFSNDYVFTTISEQGGVGRYAIEWELAGTNSGKLRDCLPRTSLSVSEVCRSGGSARRAGSSRTVTTGTWPTS